MSWLHPLPPVSAWLTLRWREQQRRPLSYEPSLRPRLKDCDLSLSFGQERHTESSDQAQGSRASSLVRWGQSPCTRAPHSGEHISDRATSLPAGLSRWQTSCGNLWSRSSWNETSFYAPWKCSWTCGRAFTIICFLYHTQFSIICYISLMSILL